MIPDNNSASQGELRLSLLLYEKSSPAISVREDLWEKKNSVVRLLINPDREPSVGLQSPL